MKRTARPPRARRHDPVPPTAHPSGARPPALPPELVPGHVAIVMDGNGRWAKARGLPRTKGHEAGEAALLDVVHGAVEIGVKHLSAYAFSTENWKRSPDEVRFLMGFNREVIRRRRDEMDASGVRVRWAGRRPAALAQRGRRAGGRGGTHPAQRRADAAVVRQLRRPGRDRRRRAGPRPRGGGRPARPGEGRREGHRPAPRRAGPARRRPVRAVVGGAAARRTSCSGSRRTPRWCSSTRCGRTSTAGICGGRSRSTPPATAATAGRCRTPCPTRLPDQSGGSPVAAQRQRRRAQVR